MRILLDTSVLVAALIKTHEAHQRALPWLEHVTRGPDKGFITAHALAELYSILTTLPARPRLSPDQVSQLIQSSVINVFEIVSLTTSDYIELIEHLASLGIIGGATYDAIHLHAAAKSEVDRVVTLNAKDFRRVYPTLAEKIIAP